MSIAACEAQGARWYIVDEQGEYTKLASRGVHNSGAIPYSAVFLVTDAATKEVMEYHPHVLSAANMFGDGGRLYPARMPQKIDYHITEVDPAGRRPEVYLVEAFTEHLKTLRLHYNPAGFEFDELPDLCLEFYGFLFVIRFINPVF